MQNKAKHTSESAYVTTRQLSNHYKQTSTQQSNNKYLSIVVTSERTVVSFPASSCWFDEREPVTIKPWRASKTLVHLHQSRLVRPSSVRTRLRVGSSEGTVVTHGADFLVDAMRAFVAVEPSVARTRH